MIFPPVYFHWWCSHLFDWKNHGRKTAPSEASMPLVLNPQAITSGGRFFWLLKIISKRHGIILQHRVNFTNAESRLTN